MYGAVWRQIFVGEMRSSGHGPMRSFTNPRQILSCGVPTIRVISALSGGILARGREMVSSVGRRAHWIAGCAGLALCVIASGGMAQERIAKAAPAFEQLDRNQDDRLSRTEAGYNRHLQDIFVESDVDGDGFVTRSEYENATKRIVVSEARR